MHHRVIRVPFASRTETPSRWAVILVFLLLFLHSRLNYNNYLLWKFWHIERCLNLLTPVVNNKVQTVPAFWNKSLGLLNDSPPVWSYHCKTTISKSFLLRKRTMPFLGLRSVHLGTLYASLCVAAPAETIKATRVDVCVLFVCRGRGWSLRGSVPLRHAESKGSLWRKGR